MSRLPILTPDTAPDAARPFLENARQASGFIPNLLGVLANAPAALEAYVTVSGLNAKASLGLPERRGASCRPRYAASASRRWA